MIISILGTTFRIAVVVFSTWSALSYAHPDGAKIVTAYGENPVWHNWISYTPLGTRSLSGEPVTAIHIVDDSSTYIATTSGVYEYDGNSLVLVPVKWPRANQKPVRRVLRFISTSGGAIYLISRNDGIFMRTPSSDSFEHIQIAQEEWAAIGNVTAALALNQEVIALVADNGIFYMDLADQKLHDLPVIINNSRAKVSSIESSAAGGIVALTHTGMVVNFGWREDRFVQEDAVQCEGINGIPRLVTSSGATPSRYIFVIGNNQLMKMHLTSNLCVTDEVGLSEFGISNVGYISQIKALPQAERVAIATDNGVILLGQDSAHQISVQNSRLQSNETIAVEPGIHGELWIGSFQGLIQAVNGNIFLADNLNVSGSTAVVDIALLNGRAYIATYDAVLRERRTGLAISFQEIALGEPIAGISAISSSDEKLAIGFRDGTYRILHPEENLLSQPVKLPSTGNGEIAISAMLELGGDRILVSTYGQGLFVVGPHHSAALRPITDPDKEDTHYIDVRQLDNGDVIAISLREAINIGPPSSWIQSIEEGDIVAAVKWRLPDAWLFAESPDGIVAGFPAGVIARIVSRDGKVEAQQIVDLESTLFALEIASTGIIYAATAAGIFHVASDGQVLGETPEFILSPLSVDYGASSSQKNGAVYFGGTAGLIVIDPLLSSMAEPQPKVSLLGVQIGYSDWIRIPPNRSPQRLTIPSSASVLRIRIGTSKLVNTTSHSVEYKVGDIEPHWRKLANDGVIHLTKLPAGEYTIDVRSKFHAMSDTLFPITVLPHWWQTTYAYVAYLVAFLALGYLIIRTYENRLLRESRAELEMQVHLAQEREVDELQAHVEATQHLAERFETHVNDLLGCVEEFLTDSDSTGEHAAVARPIRERLSALRTLQLHTTHEGGSLTSDLRAFTDDIAARLASDSRIPVTTVTEFNAARYPAEHAVYLATLIHELLREAVMEAFVPTMLAPIIALKLAGPTLHDSGRYSYELVVEDNGKGPNAGGVRGAETLERLKIIEGIASAHNGTLELSDIGGTRAVVSLQFEPGLDT
jgi:two-component sensor histidine kinase